MSFEVAAGVSPTAHLRALAHPLRLRILSLLTAAPASASELAREVGGTSANASYHLRTLEAAGLVELDSERTVRGGRERRYRVAPDRSPQGEPDPDVQGAWPAALSAELHRRWALRDTAGPKMSADGDLWVAPEVWERLVEDVRAAVQRLHDAAEPPRSEGTVRTSTTIALFAMGPELEG